MGNQDQGQYFESSVEAREQLCIYAHLVDQSVHHNCDLLVVGESRIPSEVELIVPVDHLTSSENCVTSNKLDLSEKAP